jgi:hypothetical protein
LTEKIAAVTAAGCDLGRGAIAPEFATALVMIGLTADEPACRSRQKW